MSRLDVRYTAVHLEVMDADHDHEVTEMFHYQFEGEKVRHVFKADCDELKNLSMDEFVRLAHCALQGRDDPYGLDCGDGFKDDEAEFNDLIMLNSLDSALPRLQGSVDVLRPQQLRV